MKLHVYTQKGIVFEGTSDVTTLPTEDGELSILPGHTHLLTTLQSGTIRYGSNNTRQQVSIKSGFAYISPENITILISS
jgi:F-type H+-transporting ATPase subunit epsilon